MFFHRNDVCNSIHFSVHLLHMADGLSSVIEEALIKPVTDEVGQMVEAGVQSVTGKQQLDDNDKKKQNQNLPNQQQLAQDDAKKKQNIMQYLQNYKQTEQSLTQQKRQDEQNKEQEDTHKKREIKQYEFSKKQERTTMQQQELMRAKSRAERKGGAG